MRTFTFSASTAVLLMALGGSAQAQGTDPPATSGGSLSGGHRIGVGYAAMLGGPIATLGGLGTLFGGGPAGVSGVYDAGMFHFEGMLFFMDPGGSADTTLGLGGRFWYHLSASSAADFSIGGGLGYVSQDAPGPGKADIVFIDLGAQIRAFVVSNVALSATLGLSIRAADGDGFVFGGQPVGALGIHYYF